MPAPVASGLMLGLTAGALLLLAATVGAVRKAEIDIFDDLEKEALPVARSSTGPLAVDGRTDKRQGEEGSRPLEHTPLQRSPATEATALVDEKLIPGFPDQYYCCCYEGPCYWDDHSSNDARDTSLDKSFFDEKVPAGLAPETGEDVRTCCFQVPKLLAKCPRGRIFEEDKRICSEYPEVEMSIDSCAEKVARWLNREDWYWYLPDYQEPGWFTKKHQTLYKNYIPCLEEKRSFVNDVLLAEVSYFHSPKLGNPVMMYVTSRLECNGLSPQDLQRALEVVYDEMCPFPIKGASYKPNYQPQAACSFNSTAGKIHMSDSTRCPEGHRCGCPATQFSNWDGKRKLTDSNFERLKAMFTGEKLVKVLEHVTKGFLLMLGFGISSAIWAVSLPIPVLGALIPKVLGGAGMLVLGSIFVASPAIKRYFYSCGNKVACYPMDCVYEEEVGCRINLHTDDSDHRNPYWWMPPPMHKCAVDVWGSCHLAECNAQEARHQLVGEGSAEYGIWRKKPRSVILNCQPTLAADMTHKQIVNFEHRLSGLKNKEHELQRRTTILATQMQRYCPFLTPTPYAGAALCHDGTSCNVWKLDGGNCCLDQGHGGIMQCPSKFPRLCMDNFCDTELNNCRQRGGPKDCLAEDKCPWVLPTLEDDTVRCNDHSDRGAIIQLLFPTSDFTGSEPWCAGQQGLKSCPWNQPVMCEAKTCNGEHCCSQDCSKLGGARKCEGLETAQVLEGGAVSGGRLAWQPVVALFAALVLRLARPLL